MQAARSVPGPGVGRDLLLDQPDHPVVVAATTIDDAEAVAVAVMEEVEVVTDEFQRQQGLVDGHRPGGVYLLAHHQRAVALHLDGDQASVRLGRDGPVARRGRAVAVGRGDRGGRGNGSRRGGGGHRRTRRGGRVRVGEWSRRPHGVHVPVPYLAPVRGPPEPGLELGEGEVEGRVPVLRGRFGPDRGAPRSDRQLHPFPSVRLSRMALVGDLHVNPDHLLVKLGELRELGGGVLTETRRDGDVASPDDNFHLDPPSPIRLSWAALARPTWSSTPHSPAERFAALVATTALLPVPGTRYPGAGQDLLLSRTVIGRREVALRGPFRLRLASACPAWCPGREPHEAPPPAPARAMS